MPRGAKLDFEAFVKAHLSEVQHTIVEEHLRIVEGRGATHLSFVENGVNSPKMLLTESAISSQISERELYMRRDSKESVDSNGDWNFKPCPEWVQLQRSESSLSRLKSSRSRNAKSWEDMSLCSMTYIHYSEGSPMHRFCVKLQRYIISPNSRRSMLWGSIGMMLIMYDLIAIPMQVFNVKDPIIMSWILRLYWTLDILVNFLTGFDKQGSFVVSPPAIAWRYLSGWFLLDLFLVVIEWGLIEGESDSEADYTLHADEAVGFARLGKTFKVARLFRLLRLFRVLRLMKLPLLFAKIEERIQNETIVILISIMKLTIGILIINHVVACGWYWIGVNSTGINPGWVIRLDFDVLWWGYQYATALHWSLTQFTPASMEVKPANFVERVYALVVLVFALVTFSSFVSSITNAMTRLRNLNSEYAKQFLVFQRYLRARNISTTLAVRMRRHLEHRLLRGTRMVEESEVEVLKHLSPPLRMELHYEVYSRELHGHPFFDSYLPTHGVASRKLCHKALSEDNVSTGDILFSSGESCEKTYIKNTGTLRYSLTYGDNDCRTEEVIDRCMMSEACLWTQWTHVGGMMAQSKTNMVIIEAKAFREVVISCRSSTVRVWQYAGLFCNHLNSLAELTDLDTGFDPQTAVSQCEVQQVSHDKDFRAKDHSQQLGHAVDAVGSAVASAGNTVSSVGDVVGSAVASAGNTVSEEISKAGQAVSHLFQGSTRTDGRTGSKDTPTPMTL